MVAGVSEGFSKTLEMQGVGYRASMQGKDLVLAIGFSHPVTVPPPPTIDAKSWVLMDYGSFVVHVFEHQEREFYRLENLWIDAPVVTWDERAEVSSG